MDELVRVRKRRKPQNVLMVLDSMTGQDAVNVAEQFHDAVDFDGVILTKLDGDARGGAALSVRAVTGKPILFASVGEKLDALEEFHPDRMASRILGMGDVLTLIERAQEQIDESEALAARAQAQDVRFRARRPARSAPPHPQDGVDALIARYASRNRQAGEGSAGR